MTSARRGAVAIGSLAVGLTLWAGGLWLLTPVSADNGTTSRTSRSSAKEPDATSEVRVERHLKQILENQEHILANQATILQKFDLMMEELRIVKVRSLINN